ncbi:hypothetical protein [Rhodopirellula sp. SWK7]|uniref:hypothetical protein n=1 Tax=Rhodopirellula sp. SWK7 TaxID=595460 RepID=UPI001181BF3A|nr:hypothetical protein [Rhodopirellula sp. SWK7]
MNSIKSHRSDRHWLTRASDIAYPDTQVESTYRRPSFFDVAESLTRDFLHTPPRQIGTGR